MARLSQLAHYLSTPPRRWLLPLGLFLLLFPLLPLPSHLTLYDAQRIALLVVALATVVLLALSPRLWDNWLELLATFTPRSSRLLLLLLLLGITSSLHARIPAEAFLELAQWVLLFMFASIIAATVRFQKTDTTLFIFRLIGAAVATYLLGTVVHTYLYTLFSLHTPSADIVRDFTNPRFFNQFQTWTFPALVTLAAVPSKRWRLITLLLLGSWWALLFVTAGRGALLGQLAAVIGVLLLFRKHAFNWLRHLGFGLLLGVLLYLLLFELIPVLLGTTPSSTAVTPSPISRLTVDIGDDDGRFRIWLRAWDMFRHSPWLGAGPMHFACYINEPMDPTHPHNIVLQLLAEWGGPATIIAILLSGLAFVRWFRSCHSVASSSSASTIDLSLHIGLSATLFAALAHTMVSGLLITPMSMTMFAVFLGLSWGNASVTMIPGREGMAKGGVLALASLGAILWITTMLQQQLPLLPNSNAAYHLSHPGIRQGPRFWLQGFICY